MEENGIRINKFLSEAGVCSRREADRQVELGNITIDGKVAETGARVLPGQTVLFQGKKVSKEEEMILIAFHKPVGIVCTAEKREKNNVIDYINYPKRIYPIGRLDKDSEGLLLLTNNGDIVNKMMRSGNMHERMCEYFGYRVEKLVRTRIMNIELGDLPVGTYRDVTTEEYRQLLSLIKDSSNETVIPKKYPKSERMKEKSKK